MSSFDYPEVPQFEEEISAGVDEEKEDKVEELERFKTDERKGEKLKR